MKLHLFGALVIFFLVTLVTFFPYTALADEGVIVVATVNDQPITDVDVDQRTRLMDIMDENERPGLDKRKTALRLLIDEKIKISEAKRAKANPNDKEIDQQIDRLAKDLKTDLPGLKAQLQKQNISMALLRQFVAAQISFSRYMSTRPDVDTKVEPAEVQRKYQEIKQELAGRVDAVMRDPRMRPVEVLSIITADFPVENQKDTMLLQARAVEAGQFLQKLKGCAGARAAASGIFNVKISKPLEAVADKLSPPLRAALNKAGVGRGVGPVRSETGIQAIIMCGRRTITPPRPTVTMPTMEQVSNMLRNEKYDAVEEKYMAQLRKNSFVDYKDASMALK